ncbi:MAG: amidohydrolase family protein [Oscillospiraceae bacterium]|nr:amidohydrolase family protein [Oscillospiraceae bacterium]
MLYEKGVAGCGAITEKEDQRGRCPAAGGRLLLAGGRVVDPKNGVDGIFDVAVEGDAVVRVGAGLSAPDGARVIDCAGYVVLPGLIDLHLHLGDLFDIYTSPLFKAANDGVTTAFSPGAGNTFMAPALLGAEVDRGVPLNVGVFVGAAAATATCLGADELVALLRGELDDGTAGQKLSRNAITNASARRIIGIKDHMGHFILPDETIERLFDVTSRAGVVFMSHTQDPLHAQRMAALSKGRPLHLGHATAAGCGTHADGLAGMRDVLSLVDGENITAEFVSSMLLPNRGRAEGLKMDPRARELALRALADRKVRLLVSDGQSGAVMKGFGDSADDLPAVFFLAREGVLPLADAAATMTSEPAAFLSRRTGNPFFAQKLGHLGAGALANITVADPLSGRAVCTVVNGRPVSFDGGAVRSGFGAGRFAAKQGFYANTGVGDLTLYRG